ncbi:MAG TPA: protein-tyrosine-phosphatase [Stellaceae bacterium]|nr:protein-tyrosine-phosphatase [Stellaceae bacterium]
MTADTVPFRVTICGIPELAEHCTAGVTHVLSILDPAWPDPPAFAEFAPHRRLSLRFHDVIEPTPDRLAPSRGDVERLLAFGSELATADAGHLLVHCHAGVSRSTAAAALVLAQALPDRPASAVFDAVARLRARVWPNLRMLEFGDDLLGRDGEIVAAVGAVYRRLLEREPGFRETMIGSGRGREIEAALSSPARPAGAAG